MLARDKVISDWSIQEQESLAPFFLFRSLSYINTVRSGKVLVLFVTVFQNLMFFSGGVIFHT